MYDKLKDQNPRLLLHLYQPTNKRATVGNLVYTNRIFPISVNVRVNEESEAEEEEIFLDHAFICLTVHVEDENLVYIYNVSREYNVSDKPDEEYIAGRFLFYNHPGDGHSEIYALAEEPAQGLSIPGELVERSYLRTRGDNKPSELVAFNCNANVLTLLSHPLFSHS